MSSQSWKSGKAISPFLSDQVTYMYCKNRILWRRGHGGVHALKYAHTMNHQLY